MICRAASSTEPGSLKFVTQGRNLKLTDALRDFAVSDYIVALIREPDKLSFVLTDLVATSANKS